MISNGQRAIKPTSRSSSASNFILTANNPILVHFYRQHTNLGGSLVHFDRQQSNILAGKCIWYSCGSCGHDGPSAPSAFKHSRPFGRRHGYARSSSSCGDGVTRCDGNRQTVKTRRPCGLVVHTGSQTEFATLSTLSLPRSLRTRGLIEQCSPCQRAIVDCRL